jgi:hypothetical protein
MEITKIESFVYTIRARLSYFFATKHMKQRFLVKLKCPHCQSTKESFPIGQKNTLLECVACNKLFYAGAIYICNGALEKLQEDLARANYKISGMKDESKNQPKNLQG